MDHRWAGIKVLVLGLGQYPKGSGVSAALYAARMGAEVLVSDLKQEGELGNNVSRLKKFKNVSFRLGEHRLQDIDWADIIIRNPRVRQTSPEMRHALRAGKRVESDVSLFMSRCPATILGITGTRGKSTTTTLVHDMLQRSKKKAWLGGNILVSPLTFVDEVKAKDTVVLELSSWLLETTGMVGISPAVACITNLMRDHLNSYENMEEYAEAKAQIFRHQGPDGVLVLNGDDAFCRQCAKEAPGTVSFFTSKKRKGSQAWIDAGTLFLQDGRTAKALARINKLHVRGEHMYMNMLAAALTAYAAGASIAGIRASLAVFKGLKDRQEIVAVKGGITFVNDTTATTPDGTIAAIEAFAPHHNTVGLIIGGVDKELEFETLVKAITKHRVAVTVLPGTAHEKLTKALKAARIAYTDATDLKDAFTMHANAAKKGDAIILSPGCASFGQFANEFERGEQFRTLVKAWKKK